MDKAGIYKNYIAAAQSGEHQAARVLVAMADAVAVEIDHNKCIATLHFADNSHLVVEKGKN